MRKLKRIRRPALSLRTQIRCVFIKLACRNQRFDFGHALAFRIHAQNFSALGIELANNIAHVIFRREDGNFVNRLKQNRIGGKDALFNRNRRVAQLEEVQKILLEYRKKNTPVGIVTNAGREGESKIISTLEKFTGEEINMFSLVLIGNSQTFVKAGFMLTPRGYNL